MPSFHKRKTGEGQAPRSRGLCEGMHFSFVLAKEGSTDDAPSPVDPGSSRRFVKMRSTLSIMGRVLISSLVSLTSPGMSQSWDLLGFSRATDPCSMKQKINEGWLDKWNKYGHALCSSSCRFPARSLPYPAGPQVRQEGSCEIMLDAYTYSGLSSKVDINSCASAL